MIFEPDRPSIGDTIRISAEIVNTSSEAVRVLVDLAVNFVKASGASTSKVFKGGELELAPGARQAIRKSISLRQHTTRKHYPGTHMVQALVNGISVEIETHDHHRTTGTRVNSRWPRGVGLRPDRVPCSGVTTRQNRPCLDRKFVGYFLP